MSGRHQPEHGADSPESYILRPYRLYLVNLYEDRRKWVTVPAAMGPNDAKGQARYEYPEWAAVKVEAA